jgi:GDP-D-mannose 3', 5'-epimerase
MNILVAGAGGFIGHHLVRKLKAQGHWVRGVDLKAPEFSATDADDFLIGDLRDIEVCKQAIDRPFDEVYQLAADMGGAGFIFTGENDAAIMHNSALVNLNVLECCRIQQVERIFYSSSACIYPQENQLEPGNPLCREDSAYPANPDSDYGWEKLFSERLYLAYGRNYGMNIRIARYHNVFGPEGSWVGGREKAPAALCRKIAQVGADNTIEIWGDGEQTRSFLFVDECLEGTIRLMRSECSVPVNIGSDEMISINDFANMIAGVAKRKVKLNHISGPLGVRGRTSDNALIKKELDWAPSAPLVEGVKMTYEWIAAQVSKLDRLAEKTNG